MSQPTFVLASASPARRHTLHQAGLAPVVQVSDVDEDAALVDAEQRYGVLQPDQAALVLARAKAEAVSATLDDGLVLGCDSLLELDGQAYGKPRDAAEAVQRWQLMSGRSGVLHTGHWLVDLRPTAEGGSGATLGAVASTVVNFAALSPAEIEAYVATGEPLQVAGAFTTDGLGGAYVRGIEGDHHNVVGVSLPLLRELLDECGVAWHTLWASGAS